MEDLAIGGASAEITNAEAAEFVGRFLAGLSPRRRVLLVPPDVTRYHSLAGELTVELVRRLQAEGVEKLAILPALGTHTPMTAEHLNWMYPGLDHALFHPHDWRNDVKFLGEVPGSYVAEITEGKLDFPVRCEVNRMLVEEPWDQIISIGQVVPHEVIGMANHAKNIFVGVGGFDTISKSHFVGAVHGMERIMGRALNPVRSLYQYMAEHFATQLPISYLLTVRQAGAGEHVTTRGMFAGRGLECFLKAAELSKVVNLDLLDAPLKKAVVYLDPREFKSTWLGNKAVYRTRMALADDAELIVLAPAVREFGEDHTIDGLIRKYGYRGTPYVLDAVKNNEDLRGNLAAAAHLIHASSEGRFKITWCPGELTREEIENAGFAYGEIGAMLKRYDPEKLASGRNVLDGGEEIFFIPNPGLGLWALRSAFAA